MIPLPVVFAIVSAIAGSTGAWLYQANKFERLLSEQRNEYLKRDFKALEVAHAETIRLQEKKNEAERKASIRVADARRDAAAASSALRMLSDAADTALIRAGDTHSACMANASTLRVVFGECAERRVSVAADAEGHLIDKQTLTESWPK